MGTNYIAPTWRQPENTNKDRLSNYSIDYDGSNEYITVSDNIFSGLETWSMAGFYNLSTLNVDSAIFGKYGNLPQQILLYWDNPLGWRLLWTGDSSGGQLVQLPSISADEWHFIAVTYDGTTVKMYLDDQVYTNTASTGAIITDTGAWQIGADGNAGKDFNGKLSQLSFYDYAVGATEIAYLRNGGNPLVISGAEPIAYYPLGDNSNPTAAAGYPNIISDADAVFDFNGSSYIDTTQIDLGINGSMSMWFKPDVSAVTDYVLVGEGSQGFDYVIRRQSGALVVWVGGTFYNFGLGTSIVDGDWNFLAVTKSAADINVYLNNSNGDFLVSRNEAGWTSASLKFDRIGARTIAPINLPFNGEISNFLAWDDKLETSEVTILYNNGLPLLELSEIPQKDNLMVWYKLNQSAVLTPGVPTNWTITKIGSPYYNGTSDGAYAQNGVLRSQDTNSYTIASGDYFQWNSPTIYTSGSNIVLSSSGGNAVGGGIGVEVIYQYNIDDSSWVTWHQHSDTSYGGGAYTVPSTSNLTVSNNIKIRVQLAGGPSNASEVTVSDINVNGGTSNYNESFSNTTKYGWFGGGESQPPATFSADHWDIPDNRSAYPQSFDFEGSNDYINAGSLSYITSNVFTISGWIKATTSPPTYMPLFNFQNSSGIGSKFGWNHGAAPILWYSGSTYKYFLSGPWRTDGLWHNVVLVIDRTTIGNSKLYVDGDEISGGTTSGSGSMVLNDLYLGYNPTTQFYDGEMSNVAIWNSDQSTNIDNIYNNGSPQSTYTATPTAWWKLNAANSSYVYPWSLELNGDPNVSGGGDHAKVVSNALEIRDIDSSGASTGTGGKVDFLTKEITGAYSGIDVTGEFVINTASSYTNGATLYYKIDGGSWVQFQQQLDTSGTATYAISGASGLTSTTSFQVKIEFETGNSGSSTVTLNNISIGGLYTEDFTNQDGAGWDNDTYTPPPVDWTFIDTETPAPNYTSALSFDGTNQRIELASDSDLGINSTVSVWINSDIPIAALNDIILGYDLGYILYINNNLIYIFVDGNLQSFNHNSMVAGEWYNITVVRTGDSVEVFQNGVSLGTQTGYGTSVNTIFNQIGARSGGGFSFNGKISNVSAFNSSLSSAQVQTLYNNGTPETAISFSPTSWWKLDNTTTGIQDSGSASNNGTNNGATQVATNVLTSNNGESDTLPTSALTPSDLQFESPYSNYSLDFDGTGNYIEVADANNLDLNGTSFSISMWLNPDTTKAQMLLQKYTGGNGWSIYANSTNGIYFYDGAFFALYNVAPTNGVWSHYVITADTSTNEYKIYLNSSLVNTVSRTVSITATTQPLRIGSENGTGFFWNGKIDEVAIWSSALTQAQVNQIYNNGYPNDITSLSPSNWWRLGEDAYFVGNDITIPNQITGGPTGTGSGTQTAILVGNAPGSYANGSGINLAVGDRIGDAPESTANSVSINMIPSNRISYPAGYVPTQVDNTFSMAFDGVSNSKFNVNPPTIGNDNTISAWAKRVGTGNMFLLGNTSSGGYGCYFVGTSGVYVQGSGGYFAFTNSAVTTAMVRTDWVNWVFIKNSSAGTVSVYVDGELAQSASSTGGMDSLTSIGGSGLPTGSQFPWNGNIDEVAVFNYILSERQIKQDIYEGTTAGGKTADLNNISNLTAPIAWYRMGD